MPVRGEPAESLEIPRPASTTRAQVVTVDGDRRSRRSDRLATEEPMEIRVEEPGAEQRSVAVTMRTPGHDFELAVGFLLTEGLIVGRDDVRSVRYCAVPREEQHYNVVSVSVARALEFQQRSFYATSSCGVCGKASLDAIDVAVRAGRGRARDRAGRAGRAAGRRCAGAQAVFERTGGLHAAGLFDSGGTLLICARTSAGTTPSTSWSARSCWQGRLPLSDRMLMVSGRASFEIIQKAGVAGVPIVCAVSAPSSLAVDAARRFGLTLVGFLRGERFNIYTRAERISE